MEIHSLPLIRALVLILNKIIKGLLELPKQCLIQLGWALLKRLEILFSVLIENLKVLQSFYSVDQDIF